jgi:hypothetical protein
MGLNNLFSLMLKGGPGSGRYPKGSGGGSTIKEGVIKNSNLNQIEKFLKTSNERSPGLVMGLFDRRNNQLYVANSNMSHSSLAKRIDKNNPAEVEDKSHHLILDIENFKVKRVNFDVSQAGGKSVKRIGIENMNETEIVNSIYKVMDSLKGKYKFPGGMPVEITTDKGIIKTSI